MVISVSARTKLSTVTVSAANAEFEARSSNPASIEADALRKFIMWVSF
jgi:hypothetical protein